MFVEIELQAEGSPGRNAQITEAELLVDEIDVIVQAAAGVVLEKVDVGPLVVPRPEGGAGFHGGEDVDDAGMLAAFGKDFLEALVMAPGWQMSGRVPWMITRLKQEMTPMMLSA